MAGDKKAVRALRSLTLLAWLFWWVAYWQAGRRLVRDLRRSFRVRISVLDPLLGVLVALLSPLLLANNVRILRNDGQGEGRAGVETLARTLLGTLLALLGISGTLYCRICLGRFWRAEISGRSGPVVVDCGPYARVRHPVYTSLMLVYGGTALAFYNRLNVLLVKLIAGAYVFKTLEEDRFLARNLPGYRAYAWRVPYRLMPGIF